jgi:K+-transporting ATPase ATPase A chain
MTWKTYAIAMLLFNAVGCSSCTRAAPAGRAAAEPAGFAAVRPTRRSTPPSSFATNTNWQGYGGEATMSYLTQMLALNVQNFVSAAAGMATLVAFIRGFRNVQSKDLGNFWVDLTRSVLYILLPLSFALALVLVSQGVVQNFRAT